MSCDEQLAASRRASSGRASRSPRSDRCLGDERGDRRPELVRRHRRRSGGSASGPASSRTIVSSSDVGHPVERGPPSARTRRSRSTGTRAERSPRSIRSAARRGLVDRGEHAAGDDPCGDDRDEREDERPDAEGEPQLVERRLDRGRHRGRSRCSGPVPGEPPADDERRAPGDRLPRVARSGPRSMNSRTRAGPHSLAVERRRARGSRRRRRDDDRVEAAASGTPGRDRRAPPASVGSAAAAGSMHRQVEAGLVRARRRAPVDGASVDEDVRADPEQRRRQDDEGDDRRGQAGPDAADIARRSGRSADGLVARAADGLDQLRRRPGPPRSSSAGAGSRRRRAASRRDSRSPRPGRAGRRGSGPGRHAGPARRGDRTRSGSAGSRAPSRATVRPATSISSGPSCSSVGSPRPPAGAAHRGPDAGDQLGDLERLADVVVGAGLEADDHVDRVGAGGEHDDRDGRRPSDRAADLEPSSRGSITSRRTRSNGSAWNRSRPPAVGGGVTANPAVRSPIAVISRIDGSSSTSRIRASTGVRRLRAAPAGRPGWPEDSDRHEHGDRAGAPGPVTVPSRITGHDQAVTSQRVAPCGSSPATAERLPQA